MNSKAYPSWERRQWFATQISVALQDFEMKPTEDRERVLLEAIRAYREAVQRGVFRP